MVFGYSSALDARVEAELEPLRLDGFFALRAVEAVEMSGHGGCPTCLVQRDLLVQFVDGLRVVDGISHCSAPDCERRYREQLENPGGAEHRRGLSPR